MPKVDQIINDFAVYEDAKEYYGTAEVELPEISFLTEELQGAGISGKLETVVIGFMEAMTAKFNFRTVTKATVKMTEPRIHNLDCRVAQQIHNSRSGNTETEAIKHIMRTMPKKVSVGKAAPASKADASGEHTVYAYQMYRNGKKEVDLDPMNYICEINGVDYLADVRKALGK